MPSSAKETLTEQVSLESTVMSKKGQQDESKHLGDSLLFLGWVTQAL